MSELAKIELSEIQAIIQEELPESLGAIPALQQRIAKRVDELQRRRVVTVDPSKIISLRQNLSYPALTSGEKQLDFPIPPDAKRVIGIALYRTDANVQEFDFGCKWPNGDIHQLRTHRDFECKNIQDLDKRFKTIDHPKKSNRLILQTNFDTPSVNQVDFQVIVYFEKE